jgi:hypothetical protein
LYASVRPSQRVRVNNFIFTLQWCGVVRDEISLASLPPHLNFKSSHPRTAAAAQTLLPLAYVIYFGCRKEIKIVMVFII